MRLTLRTDLAMRVLMYCAAQEGRIVRTAQIAKHCNASLNHLLQIVSQLQAGGYISTTRGRAGGLKLAHSQDSIFIGPVFRMLEGDVPLTECFDTKRNSCPLIDSCRLKNYLHRAIESFYSELDRVTLSDLMTGNCGLHVLLTQGQALAAACTQTEVAAA